MTITASWETQQAYEYCQDHPKAHKSERELFTATDMAMHEMLQEFKHTFNLKFPGNDTCYNIELSIFKALAEANGFCIEILAAKNHWSREEVA